MNKETRTIFNTTQQTLANHNQLERFNALLAAFLNADGYPRPERAPVKFAGVLAGVGNSGGLGAAGLGIGRSRGSGCAGA